MQSGSFLNCIVIPVKWKWRKGTEKLLSGGQVQQWAFCSGSGWLSFNTDDLHKPFLSFPPLVQGRLPLFAIAISFGDITSRQSWNTFLIIITWKTSTQVFTMHFQNKQKTVLLQNNRIRHCFETLQYDTLLQKSEFRAMKKKKMCMMLHLISKVSD